LVREKLLELAQIYPQILRVIMVI